MREIKYRAWNGEYMWEVISLDLRKGMPTVIEGYPGHGAKGYLFGVEIKALSQFTGLKDKNAKDIYEGDIIQRPSVGVPMIVRWNEKNACFDLAIRDPKDFDAVTIWYTQFANTDYEVIGNIYENPELVKR